MPEPPPNAFCHTVYHDRIIGLTVTARPGPNNQWFVSFMRRKRMKLAIHCAAWLPSGRWDDNRWHPVGARLAPPVALEAVEAWLVARRLVELDNADDPWGLHWDDAIDAARDALAAEPVGEGEGPSLAEIDAAWLATWNPEANCYDVAVFARSILARWGHPAAPPAPAPVMKDRPSDEELYNLADEFAGDPVPAMKAALARWGCPAAPAAPEPPAEALAARPLLEQVARLADRIGAHTVGEITAISDGAAAWLRDNPPGQPVAIEPRGCPTPGACSCVEPPTPQAPEGGEVAELGEVTTTARGFELIEFLDCYDKPCSLQQSSLAIYQDPGTSAIWLGQGDDRMHLKEDQVKALITHLQRWLDNGSFRAATLPQQQAPPAPAMVPVAVEALTRLYWWGGMSGSYGYCADVVLGVRDWIDGGMVGGLSPLPAWVADRCPPLLQVGEGQP